MFQVFFEFEGFLFVGKSTKPNHIPWPFRFCVTNRSFIMVIQSLFWVSGGADIVTFVYFTLGDVNVMHVQHNTSGPASRKATQDSLLR